jgi:hypothetical protein
VGHRTRQIGVQDRHCQRVLWLIHDPNSITTTLTYRRQLQSHAAEACGISHKRTLYHCSSRGRCCSGAAFARPCGTRSGSDGVSCGGVRDGCRPLWARRLPMPVHFGNTRYSSCRLQAHIQGIPLRSLSSRVHGGRGLQERGDLSSSTGFWSTLLRRRSALSQHGRTVARSRLYSQDISLFSGWYPGLHHIYATQTNTATWYCGDGRWVYPKFHGTFSTGLCRPSGRWRGAHT